MKTAVCVKKSEAVPLGVEEHLNEYYVFDENDLFKLTATLENREICEKDKTLLQVIPYVTLVDRESREIFIYRQGVESQCSIGVGGHMQSAPNSRVTLLEMVVVEAARHLEEKVGLLANPAMISRIMIKLKSGACGVLYSNRDQRDAMHIGVAFFLEIDRNDLGDFDKRYVTSGQFIGIKELARAHRAGFVELHTWSRMVLNMLVMSKKFNV